MLPERQEQLIQRKKRTVFEESIARLTERVRKIVQGIVDIKKEHLFHISTLLSLLYLFPVPLSYNILLFSVSVVYIN